jgi:DNA invertase Pin-like site-specific DNA recombinase
MALTAQDKLEIQRKFLEGQSCEQIARLYSISGQYVRRLATAGGWKELREKFEQEASKEILKQAARETAKEAVKSNKKLEEKIIAEKSKPIENAPVKDEPGARELALRTQAKNPLNYRKDTPITREYILDSLRRGVSLANAAKSAGIHPNTVKRWKNEDGEFAEDIEVAQAEFLRNIEGMACNVTNSREAIALLERHPLSRRDWGKQEESKHTIKIEYSYSRENKNVVDAEFQEVPQIESPPSDGDGSREAHRNR